MTYKTFADVVMHMVSQVRYDRAILWGSDAPVTEVTYGMSFNDYMELTSEILSNSNKMIQLPDLSTGFIIKQLRVLDIVVNLIESESLALRMGGMEEGDKHFGVNLPQAPVIQMQTLPHQA